MQKVINRETGEVETLEKIRFKGDEIEVLVAGVGGGKEYRYYGSIEELNKDYRPCEEQFKHEVFDLVESYTKSLNNLTTEFCKRMAELLDREDSK